MNLLVSYFTITKTFRSKSCFWIQKFYMTFCDVCLKCYEFFKATIFYEVVAWKNFSRSILDLIDESAKNNPMCLKMTIDEIEPIRSQTLNK